MREASCTADVKPANIVRDGVGVVKLVDFGLVAHADGGDQLIRGRVAGTPQYLAPEVAQGELATPASDVYALAVVAFELLTGRLPHEETTAVELMRAKVSRPAPSLATSSRTRFAPELERAMRAALSGEPGDRPMVAELIERLRSCIPIAGQRDAGEVLRRRDRLDRAIHRGGARRQLRECRTLGGASETRGTILVAPNRRGKRAHIFVTPVQGRSAERSDEQPGVCAN